MTLKRDVWILQFWPWKNTQSKIQRKWVKMAGDFTTLDEALRHWKLLAEANDRWMRDTNVFTYRIYNPRTKDVIMCDIL